MKSLPQEVYREFEAGNFVVKGSDRSFSQVSPDQAQEWLNGTGKKGGAIVGITKTKSALSRWALSHNVRSQIATETRELLHVNLDESIHNECTPGRQERDNNDEKSFVLIMKRTATSVTEYSNKGSCYIQYLRCTIECKSTWPGGAKLFCKGKKG